jgi:hypothetical protein
MSAHRPHALSPLVVPLLKGVLCREDSPSAWQALVSQQAAVRDYVAVLGLALVVDEDDGFAFLRVLSAPAADATAPSLIARRPLSYAVSLTLALLRKALAESDAAGLDGPLILTREDIAELLRTFLPSGSNEAKLIDMVDSHVGKIVELGFLRRAGQTETPSYEVRRVLKAFIDTQWLADFDARLAAYQTQLRGTSTERTRGVDG